MTAAHAEQREWTDATGQYRVKAELVAVESGQVVLRLDDGREIKVPLKQLSARDQAIARTNALAGDRDAPQGEPASAATRPRIDLDQLKETAVSFFEGLRQPDRQAAIDLLTAAAREVNRTADSPLAKLPSPDQGRRSILTGRPELNVSVAEVPVRVQSGNQRHMTKLHLRREADLWRVFAISAVYPDGEKSIDFESKPMPAGKPNPMEALVGRPMPLAGFTLTGQPLDTSRFAGKVVLVDFWATWCGPCRAEMPNILANWNRYHEQGFEVIAISLDRDLEALRKYAVENSLPWTVVVDEDPRSPVQMGAEYSIRAIPTAVLIGRDGKVASINARGKRLGQQVAQLIGAAAGD